MARNCPPPRRTCAASSDAPTRPRRTSGPGGPRSRRSNPYLAHKHDAIAIRPDEIDALVKVTDSWHAAQLQHGRRRAVMIACDNLTRERLNRTARSKLKHDHTMGADGIVIGGREYASGDRIITRRNDRRIDVDNGSLATIIAIDRQDGSMIVETDSGEPRAIDAEYVARHREHAYALTAHAAQRATVVWAGVIGRPGDFSREWAYTALSRAQGDTAIHLISQRSEHERERDDYAPDQPSPNQSPNRPDRCFTAR